jgi:hypothetical protein
MVMRLEELFEKNYAPKVSVYLDGVKNEDKGEIAGMLRGLMCAIEGWGSNKGLTNDVFENSPVVLEFSNVENAHYFKSCVEYYFSDDILEALEVKKRIYRS